MLRNCTAEYRRGAFTLHGEVGYGGMFTFFKRPSNVVQQFCFVYLVASWHILRWLKLLFIKAYGVCRKESSLTVTRKVRVLVIVPISRIFNLMDMLIEVTGMACRAVGRLPYCSDCTNKVYLKQQKFSYFYNIGRILYYIISHNGGSFISSAVNLIANKALQI